MAVSAGGHGKNKAVRIQAISCSPVGVRRNEESLKESSDKTATGGGQMTYEELRHFIERRMQMSHVYQPVMLLTLLRNFIIDSRVAVQRVLHRR